MFTHHSTVPREPEYHFVSNFYMPLQCYKIPGLGIPNFSLRIITDTQLVYWSHDLSPIPTRVVAWFFHQTSTCWINTMHPLNWWTFRLIDVCLLQLYSARHNLLAWSIRTITLSLALLIDLVFWWIASELLHAYIDSAKGSVKSLACQFIGYN